MIRKRIKKETKKEAARLARNKEKAPKPEEEKEQETAKETEAESQEETKDAGEAPEETAAPDEELEKKVAELTDRLQRTMAEFDNYRKRTEKEKAARFEVGARSVIERVLPVLDSFERGLVTVEEERKDDPFVDGMDKVYKQMFSVLEDLGVAPIEAVGKPFNPDFHNAVMHVEDEELGENVVVEEFQKGYTYKGTVVRYSMVKVAN